MTVFLSFCRCFSWFLHLFPCNSLIISNIIVHWKSIFWQFFSLCHPRLLARLSGVVKMLVQNLLKTQTCPCLWCSKSIFNLRGIKIAIFPIRKAKKGDWSKLVKIEQTYFLNVPLYLSHLIPMAHAPLGYMFHQISIIQKYCS